MNICKKLSILLLCIGLSGIAFADSTTFTIALFRPFKKKDKCEVKVVGVLTEENNMEMKGKGKESVKHSVKITLHAKADVKKVDDDGQIDQAKFKIIECLIQTDKGSGEFIAKGKTLSYKKSKGGPELKVNGKKLSNDEISILKEILDGMEDPPTELFDIKGEAKVGQKFKVRKEALTSGYNDTDLAVNSKNVSGTLKLTNSKKVKKETILSLEGSFKIKNPIPKNFQGMEVKSSSVEYTFKGIYPADPNQQNRIIQTKTSMNIKGKVKSDDHKEWIHMNFSKVTEVSTVYLMQ